MGRTPHRAVAPVAQVSIAQVSVAQWPSVAGPAPPEGDSHGRVRSSWPGDKVMAGREAVAPAGDEPLHSFALVRCAPSAVVRTVRNMASSGSSSPRFRRPAPLFDSVAEAIPGEPDPSTSTDLAHDSAQALLHGVFHSSDPEVVERVLRLAAQDGLSDLAALWSSSPASTLPGALWRLYVLHTWVQHSGDDVVRRYRAGSRTVPGLRYLSGFSEPPDVMHVQRTMDDILRGAFVGDLGLALTRAGAVATILAHGTAQLADSDRDPDRTLQAERLLSTGEELAMAGRHAEAGRLD